jgi:hypothetical protein
MARAGGILCGGWASRPPRGVRVASLLSKGDGGSKAICGTGKVNWMLERHIEETIYHVMQGH